MKRMNISEVNRSVRCDMPNCKNFAKIKVQKPGFIMVAGMYLCDECAKELYEMLGHRFVPKSPDNMLNKRIRTKKEINNEN